VNFEVEERKKHKDCGSVAI